MGLSLYRTTVRTPGGYSVRFRRDLAAAVIDSFAERFGSPSILSVACGHLREAGLSSAVRQRRLGRFVAIDQDRRSIELVCQSTRDYGVEAMCMSASELMREGGSLGSYHLVYALGLYDYLSLPSAKLLTQQLFGVLRSEAGKRHRSDIYKLG